jgi:hypothetical protein
VTFKAIEFPAFAGGINGEGRKWMTAGRSKDKEKKQKVRRKKRIARKGDKAEKGERELNN